MGEPAACMQPSCWPWQHLQRHTALELRKSEKRTGQQSFLHRGPVGPLEGTGAKRGVRASRRLRKETCRLGARPWLYSELVRSSFVGQAYSRPSTSEVQNKTRLMM